MTRSHHGRRSSILLALAAALFGGTATADTGHGWNFTPPEGWTMIQETPDHLSYRKVVDSTFCMIALYDPRPMTKAADAEATAEWNDLIERPFTATNPRPVGHGLTKSGVPYVAVGAAVSDAERHNWNAQLWVLMPSGAVASVMVLSSTPASLAGCAPRVQLFLDSLTVANAGSAPPTPAPVEGAPAGAWATSVAGRPNDGSPTVRRQYLLGADGTYRYHSEIWGGAYRADDYTLIDERGTFSVSGDKLTISPSTATSLRRGKKTVGKTVQLPLEKVTYSWRTHYFAGIKETQLILTPGARTTRDGEFASNDQFPNSYLLSGSYKPSWEFAW